MLQSYTGTIDQPFPDEATKIEIARGVGPEHGKHSGQGNEYEKDSKSFGLGNWRPIILPLPPSGQPADERDNNSSQAKSLKKQIGNVRPCWPYPVARALVFSRGIPRRVTRAIARE